MRPDGRNHGDRVHVGGPHELVEVAMHWNPGMGRLDAFAGRGSLIANRTHLAALKSTQIAHNIRPPVTVADDAELKHKRFAL